ncbi:MAG: filamentous hemagglutinin N-terminal domain-containing protein [Leptolyngbyaceae cyanobacterium]
MSCATVWGLAAPTVAQITPDATLGDEGSLVTSDVELQGDLADLIEGGARRGSNLFHSFVEFNVGEGQRVYFASPESVESILSRVTGGNPSNIFGTLGVDGSADLFLLNPNGVVFGENASLDISGSFYVTTAEAISLGPGVFSAVEPQSSSLLTVAPEVSFFNYLTVDSGDIASTAQLSTGADLTLAGQSVDLQGQVTAGENLFLLAQDTVSVRDTAAEAFVAQSGNDLTIQGNQGIAILALNHLEQTPFVSGGDSTLISDGVISADAHFEVGGDFSIRTLTGDVADFVSLEDPIFTVDGDFAVGDYTGASLQVTAGNDITYDTVQINAIDPTIDPDNPAFILNAGGNITGTGNVSTSFAIGGLEVEFASGGDIQVADIRSRGGPIRLTSQAGDITAMDFDSNGGPITLTSQEGSITVGSLDSRNGNNEGGNITLASEGSISTGDLLSFSASLSSMGSENATDGGAISVSSVFGDVVVDGDISSYSRSTSLSSPSSLPPGSAGNGGAVAITSQAGDVTLNGDVRSESFSFSSSSTVSSSSGNTGNGGAIAITSQSGDITLNGEVRSDSSSQSGSSPTSSAPGSSDASGDTGDGGAIASASQSGNITLNGELRSDSTSFSFLSNSSGDAGNGGAITLSSAFGDIILNSDVRSFSFSSDQRAGDGGVIDLVAPAGNIQGTDTQLVTFAVVEEGGTTGRGGTVTLAAENIISGLEVFTLSLSGDSGRVQIQGQGDLLIQDTNLVTSAQVEVPSPLNPDGSITLNLENIGQSGEARIISAGNLTLTNVDIQADANGDQQAGDITIASPSQITFNDSQINSNTNSDGDAGRITILAERLNLGETDRISAATSGSGNGGDIVITSTDAASDITVNGPGRLTVATNSSGPAGSIELTAQNLTLADGVTLSAVTNDAGAAGDIVFTNLGNVQLNDSRILSDTNATGSGGEIIFANLDSLTIDNSTVTVDTEGLGGNAGDIRILNVGEVQFVDSNILSNADALGTGGSIIFAALQGLSLNNSTLQTDTAGFGGNAGSIAIEDVGTVSLNNNSLVLAAAAAGANAGNIDVTAELVTASPGENNDIIANAVGGSGGAVTVTAIVIANLTEQSGFSVAELRAMDSNDVSASATGGPVISNDTGGLMISNDLSGVLNQQGTVNLRSESIPTLSDITIDFADSDRLTLGSCIARQEDDVEGSFVVTGNGGIPQQPDGDPVSTYPTGTVRTIPGATASQTLQEPEGIYQLADGRLVLSHTCRRDDRECYGCISESRTPRNSD